LKRLIISIFVIIQHAYRTFQQYQIPMSTSSDSSNFTLLIVEDNSVNMTLNKIILKSMFPAIKILEAYNGLEAVEIAAKEHLDFILMDIMMPIMDGYEATIQIRQQEKNKHTPIVALTASIMPDEMQKCLMVGFDDSISKPIVRDTLYMVIVKYLNKE